MDVGGEHGRGALAVMRWLEGLLACHDRAEKVMCALGELDEGSDGMSGWKPDPAAVRTQVEPDKVGKVVAQREEVRCRLEAEADDIASKLDGARRVLEAAWEANPGVADPAFAYTMKRYVEGAPFALAARSVGATEWEARTYPRRVAAIVYGYMPDRFPARPDMPYGYDGNIDKRRGTDDAN